MRGVITLAGEGSRMLPWTRGVRKEFLPVYDRGSNGGPVLKPVANLVMETLVGAGVRDLVMVVSANDSAVAQNYFTIDREFLRRHSRHADRLAETTAFYRTLSQLRVRFAVQPSPMGFGDAVLRSSSFVGVEPFLLHAGDAVLLEKQRGRLPQLMGSLREREDLDAVLLVRRVANPKNYGVVEGAPVGREGGFRRLDVGRMEEKPSKPRSSWAATALYCFSPRLYDALKKVEAATHPKELEVTSGIQRMLEEGASIAALIIDPKFAEWRSVGSPEGYLRAIQRTFRLASRSMSA
jgi:UTP--glucose-1-phosphate uridylyltransferase